MKIISQFQMGSSEEEELALFGFVLIMDDDGKKKKKKHRFWIREIYKKREEQGVFSNLLRELRLDDREYFFTLIFFFGVIFLYICSVEHFLVRKEI